MNRRLALSLTLLALPASAQNTARLTNKIAVRTEPPVSAQPQAFRDSKYGVSFLVPPGWAFDRHDGQFSTFHADARSAPNRSEMRGVASLDFNPFPQSVLSGATFYYSVARHSSDSECAAEARPLPAPAAAAAAPEIEVLDIAGMEFRHGHDEHGTICTEARDEVYTAFRKGSCYRFDLTLNTFCSISSGAEELSAADITAVQSQMTGILSTVALNWRKGRTHPVPAPRVTPPLKRDKPDPQLIPRQPITVQAGQ